MDPFRIENGGRDSSDDNRSTVRSLPELAESSLNDP
jgi:hypothetical protein